MVSMSPHQPAVVDERGFTVRRTIRIGAPIEHVWSAVTEPEHISRWFGRTVLAGSGVGAHGTVTWPDRGDAVPIRVEALDPPRMVSYRWCNEEPGVALPDEVDDEHSTVFTFTLESVADGTVLTVVETGFEATADPSGNLQSHAHGWTGELDKLADLLEGGS